MKCYVCGKSFPWTQWRTINLGATKTTIRGKGVEVGLSKSKPINYYTLPGTQRYTAIYACPHCGTLRIRTPHDKN